MLIPAKLSPMSQLVAVEMALEYPANRTLKYVSLLILWV